MTRLPAFALATLILSACSSGASNSPPPDDQTPKLAWSACPDNEALECASLAVPMNYLAPEGETIELALNRLAARQQPASGVLLVNGGGPAASLDITEIIAANEALPDSVRQRYDVVSFDPRGYGESTPVRCELPPSQGAAQYLATQSQIESYVVQSAESANQCFNQVGSYLLQIGSMNVVRDMDSIRQALAVEQISFLAQSYGTRLAALYLQSYPANTGSFILDASEAPDSAILVAARDVLPGLQTALEAVLARCTQSDPACDPELLNLSLAQELDDLVADNNQDGIELLIGLLGAAVEDEEVAGLLIAPLVTYLQEGDAQGLLDLVQLLSGDEEEEDTADSDETQEDGRMFSVAQRATLCADDPFRPTAADLLANLEAFNQTSDVFAETSIQIAGVCAGWPASTDPLARIESEVAPASPVALVVGGSTDTTAPAAWSEEMAQALGGVYLASSHEGHTVAYQGKSECVDDAVTDYLLTGQVPGTEDCL